MADRVDLWINDFEEISQNFLRIRHPPLLISHSPNSEKIPDSLSASLGSVHFFGALSHHEMPEKVLAGARAFDLIEQAFGKQGRLAET